MQISDLTPKSYKILSSLGKRKWEVFVPCFLVNEWAGTERPRLQDGRRVEIKRGVWHGVLAGDAEKVLGVVTGQGVDCVGMEWQIGVGCEEMAGRDECGGTSWAGKVLREVGAVRLDRTSLVVTDCNRK